MDSQGGGIRGLLVRILTICHVHPVMAKEKFLIKRDVVNVEATVPTSRGSEDETHGVICYKGALFSKIKIGGNIK